MVDSLFQGASGGDGTHNTVLSSADYLANAARSFGNIEDGYYISPAFLDKLAIHVAKNFLELPKIKVPLILGIWGGKGQGEIARPPARSTIARRRPAQCVGSSRRSPRRPASPSSPLPAGKTFQCNLAYKKLGIAPIVMSAGELESGNAGEPAKLIRQRYREASDVIRKGKMCSLFINDLDAGAQPASQPAAQPRVPTPPPPPCLRRTPAACWSWRRTAAPALPPLQARAAWASPRSTRSTTRWSMPR
jgi:hypothetical protein